MMVATAGDTPERPEGLGKVGKQFWAEAFAQSWVKFSGLTMVLLIARKLDEREGTAAQCYQTPAN